MKYMKCDFNTITQEEWMLDFLLLGIDALEG
jgi:hypothetical protein